MSLEMLMLPAEKELFRATLSACSEYFEYGLGGSTVEAAKTVSTVAGVDSSLDWCNKVTQEAPSVRAHHVDIGPIKHAGYPDDRSTRDKWPDYPRSIFDVANKPDVILIDGRFRVACAAQVFLFCKHKKITPTVLLHDAYRGHYVSISRLFRLHSTTPSQSNKKGMYRFDVDLSISETVANDIFEKFKYDAR